MFNPISTYRIQFNKDFTFKQFENVIPYLHKLGIRTIYASPIFEAAPGSMHGYDTTNPHHINPEIGTEEDLISVSVKLRKLNIKWIQDIVPNHMAFHSNNLWLMDVLEKGLTSDYFSFFDINWSGDMKTPLMIPFLGDDLDNVIENGELKIIVEEEKLYFRYHDQKWPINKTSYSAVEIKGHQIHEAIAKVNKEVSKLKSIANAQFYRFCNWRETDKKINYRRFFTVNSLICLNIQHKETFDFYHAYTKSLLERQIFEGLRIDHIDGLYDPETYLKRLRVLAGEDTFIIVEKILKKGEKLPSKWPIEGTTGYDSLANLNNLLTNRSAEKKISNFYHMLVNNSNSVMQDIYEKKAAILNNHMRGELDNLCIMFLNLNLFPEKVLKPELIKEVLSELLTLCPVYRFYGNNFPLTANERKRLRKLLKLVSMTERLKPAAEVLKYIWLKKPEEAISDYNEKAREFYLRCMQFTGPLMAKGVEDTLMYTYHRFIAHNEVGDSPENFGIGTKKFHKNMKYRLKHWPLSLNATATHDTKRGEDIRARLNVLGDIPDQWIEVVEQWNTIHKEQIQHYQLAQNDVYFIYQTILGSFPMPGTNTEHYIGRLEEYLEKALREGKQKSDWANPNFGYEESIKKFGSVLMEKNSPFQTTFSIFHRKICDFGIINSLIQLLLKFTLPGTADIYQGTEIWDLSLVDPDNRRKVDYVQRENWLNKINSIHTINHLWSNRYSGEIKLWLLQLLLSEQNKNSKICTDGQYIPLKVKGKYCKHILAFARKQENNWILVAVPLHLAKILDGNHKSITSVNWMDTRIILPKGFRGQWQNLLTNESGGQSSKSVAVDLIFASFPMALLKMQSPANSRGSGILMHITSLPSSYGIGDFGPESKRFIEFLAGSGQKYWQMLPLNPISAEQCYSPYSSVSSMAGNIFLISPEVLAAEGLISKKVIKANTLKVSDKINFEECITLKNYLINLAYENFKNGSKKDLNTQFQIFCEKEDYWLTNYALYADLKAYHQNKPWYQWDLDFKEKNPGALKQFSLDRNESLEKIKWDQFIFFKQWYELKIYANSLGIKLFGDLPYYLSHDSADVWANQKLFNIDKAGEMLGIAGVPPDYFNSDGQLWGMPVYNWEEIKKSDFKWFLSRISKNMELFDLLRLDHFRAFSSYWEVPEKESTAINGVWKSGPGEDFFKCLEENFPDLPFVAEDLGEITEEVYSLRDKFNLPGMKVLQFAFGEGISESPHIPYRYFSDNFIAYTGTHDNNTILGWYENDLSKDDRKRLEAYAGKINADNVHLVLSKLALASIAKIVILPLQDLLGLRAFSRMNTPASIEGNWLWRLKNGQLRKNHRKQLQKWTDIYGRS